MRGDWRAAALAAAAGLALQLLVGCERELRRDHPPPPPSLGALPRTSSLHAGPAASGSAGVAAPEPAAAASEAPLAPAAYVANADAVSQGQRWYRWFNCNGCHAQGGGDSGPPLMDNRWRYGGEPAQIVASIRQGRPNGMPSFEGRITDEQLWQLAAYIRSMGGELRSDVAPGRSDSLTGTLPPQRREPEPARREAPPVQR